jgi:hypothetical protein
MELSFKLMVLYTHMFYVLVLRIGLSDKAVKVLKLCDFFLHYHTTILYINVSDTSL